MNSKACSFSFIYLEPHFALMTKVSTALMKLFSNFEAHSTFAMFTIHLKSFVLEYLQCFLKKRMNLNI